MNRNKEKESASGRGGFSYAMRDLGTTEPIRMLASAADQVIASERLPTATFETPIDVRSAAEFLGVSPSLVYSYVERKQIPHFRMMGRAIRFRLSELDSWRQQFHVNGGING
jgi:excisionase family DNA binding protein